VTPYSSVDGYQHRRTYVTKDLRGLRGAKGSVFIRKCCMESSMGFVQNEIHYSFVVTEFFTFLWGHQALLLTHTNRVYIILIQISVRCN
jgi:hypothetical protein